MIFDMKGPKQCQPKIEAKFGFSMPKNLLSDQIIVGFEFTWT